MLAIENIVMDKQDDELAQMPMWKSYLYLLQQKAPKPKRIVCQKEVPNKPPFYGREYHGPISREDTDFLLTIGGEGSYLIRESQRARGQYTLAIRFESVTKNFKLYHDGQHYVGEKRFDTIQDLVADGLITFYLESKAADYIAALSSQSNYAESPYVAYNTMKKKQLQSSAPKRSAAVRNAATSNAANSNANQQRPVSVANAGVVNAGAVTAGAVVIASPSPLEVNHRVAVNVSGGSSGASRNSNRVSLPVDGRLSHILDSAIVSSPSSAQHSSSQHHHQSHASPLPASHQPPTSQSQSHSQQPPSSSSSHPQSHLLQQQSLQHTEDSVTCPDVIGIRISNSTNTDGPGVAFPAKPVSLPASPQATLAHLAGTLQPSSRSLHRPTVANRTNAALITMLEESHFVTPPSSPAPPSFQVSGDQEKQQKTSNVPSNMAWLSQLEVMGSEKQHNFRQNTFKGPHWCDYCANFLWGLIAQGVRCQDCGFNAHKKCSEKVPNDCVPVMKFVKRVFGVDLITLVKAQNTLIPVVVEKCIQEIEKRGVDSEGIYRVAGFHDDVEAIKMSFDKDGEMTDITTCKYEDINTITCVLKLYFRLLPIPLITFDVYFKVIDTISRDDITFQNKLERLKGNLQQLPHAHYHTLKYLMGHLYRVTEHQQRNMMNIENLAIIFAPTLLRSPEPDPLFNMTTVKSERELIENMIAHHNKLFIQSG